MDALPETLTGHNLARRLLSYSSVSSGIVCLLVIFIAPVFDNTVDPFWIVGLSFLLPIKALHGIYDAWYKSRQLIAESIVYYQMVPAILKVCFLLLCWILWPNIYFVVAAIVLSELFPLLARFYRTPLNFLAYDGKSEVTKWDFKYAIQLVATTGISRTVKYSDILMMGLLASSVKTAEYVIASKMAVLLLMAHGINNNIITPRIGRFLGENDYKSINLEYHQSRILTLLFAVVGALCFTVFGKHVLQIFGEYQDSYSTLMILCATYVVHVSFGMSGGYLNIAGYSNLTLLTTVVTLGTNIGLNYFLIPVLGADGAAIAMFISFGLANIITYSLIFYKDKLNIYSLELAIYVLLIVSLLLLNAFGKISDMMSSLALIFILIVFIFSERKFLSKIIFNTLKQLGDQ
jgi:O-antigen/teichoic acid export membrane protein